VTRLDTINEGKQLHRSSHPCKQTITLIKVTMRVLLSTKKAPDEHRCLVLIQPSPMITHRGCRETPVPFEKCIGWCIDIWWYCY